MSGSESDLDFGHRPFFNLGRFSPRDKAQHLLLEALSADAWKNRDWQLCFIGVSGFGKQSLLSLIQFYKLDPSKIRIIDHTEEVLEAITDQDVLLMPSLSEGTPFAMVEAMACGRPALGTPVGGIPELIIDGERGWLADNISAEAVAEKLEQCWQERKNWASYGSNAQKFVSVTYNSENSFPELISWLKNDLSS
ncbi:MAG: glycosyltransferase [Chitinophagaceae bacterium]|nr:glycosyltransferase [Chitinophagaceae bacterium]